MTLKFLFYAIILLVYIQRLQCLPILPAVSEYSDNLILANKKEEQKSFEFNYNLQYQDARNPEIAFQATLTTMTETVEVKGTVRFNHVITNIGGAYDSNTGIFTAPVSGLYNFNTNIVAEKGHYVEASIVVNGEATVSAISDHRLLPQDLWDQGNAAAVLSLHRGDIVAVSILWPTGIHVIHGAGKTSFSGYLIRSHD